MIRRLGYGSNQHIIGIAIMAAFTVVSDARVNEALCRFERRSCAVAYITILLRRYMFDRHPGTDHTIMTGRAIAAIYTRVVKRRISKVRDVMAHGAIRSGWHVINVLTNIDHIVVAGFTVISDTDMIKAAGSKGARGVTNTAIFSSRHVVEGLTARINTMA
jgi:hypothetical protein